jgi:ligand-binding sensor domain-containing protein
MFDGVTWRHIGDTSGAISPAILDINQPALPIDTGASCHSYRFLRIDGKTDTVDCSTWAEFSRVKDSICIPPSMTLDTAGRLWIGTESGLVCCDESGAREHGFQTGPLGTYPTSLVEDAKGNIWVLGGGLSIFDGRSWTYPQKTEPGIASFPVGKAVPTSSDSGGMWLKSITYNNEDAKIVGNGIAYYNGRSWHEIKFYTRNNGLASDAVLDMAVDGDNTLWCVCGGDSTYLCMFKNNTWTTIASPDSLKGAVRQIFIDRKGGIWLLANNSARFDGTHWQVFSAVLYEGYAGSNSVFEDGKGVMWFATWSQGMYRYDGTTWSRVIVDAASPASCVTSIGEDATGALWVGLGCDWTGSTYVNCKGLWQQDGTGWKKFSTENGLGFDLVTTMLCDTSGAMWFACYPGVGQGVTSVSRFDGTNWKTFTMKDGLSDPRVRSMLAAANGDIWFTTYTGITRLKSDVNATRFTQPSKSVFSARVSISKIVVMPARHAGKIGSAELYDILGRRVNQGPSDRKPLVKGVYIAVNKSGHQR